MMLCACTASAQNYPSKPIHWILPFAPGGPTDTIARLIAPKLSERLGQPVILENKSGAAGNIAADYVARASADGYTVLYVVPGLVTNLYLVKNSPDPRLFRPVIMVGKIPMVLLSSNAFPANSVADVIQRVKSASPPVSCASPGSVSTVGCEFLKAHTGKEVLIVNYRGSAPSMNALMSGEVDLLFDLANNALPQVKAGRVRAIASASLEGDNGPFGRLPPVADQIPGFELVSWQGLVAPKGTPDEVVQKLNREAAAVLAEPDVRKQLAETGVEVVGGAPSMFERALNADLEKYGKTLRDAGIKPE